MIMSNVGSKPVITFFLLPGKHTVKSDLLGLPYISDGVSLQQNPYNDNEQVDLVSIKNIVNLELDVYSNKDLNIFKDIKEFNLLPGEVRFRLALKNEDNFPSSYIEIETSIEAKKFQNEELKVKLKITSLNDGESSAINKEVQMQVSASKQENIVYFRLTQEELSSISTKHLATLSIHKDDLVLGKIDNVAIIDYKKNKDEFSFATLIPIHFLSKKTRKTNFKWDNEKLQFHENVLGGGG